MPSSHRWPDAALAGLACSMRSTAGPALLAARGRISGKPRIAVLGAAAGELTVDKLPVATDRIEPPAVAGRVASGAYTGHAIAGPAGVAAGALGAAVGSLATWRLRGLAVQRTGLPDPVVAIGEDAIALGAAALATRLDVAASDDAASGNGASGNGASPEDAEPRSPAVDAATGLLAGAVGTAAMTLAAGAQYVLLGGEPSSAPADAADRLKRAVGRGRLRRGRRPAANQLTHWLYGTGWGIPYGVLARRVPVAPEITGPAFGLVVWATGLGGQPALGVADPPWKRSAASLASEAAMHLVYGIGAGAVVRALSR
jgi:hypothetical protein